MIFDFSKMEVTRIENFKGGSKEIYSKMFTDNDTKIMLSVLKSGASIGYHKHETNCEVIFMIKGSASVTFDTEELRLKSGQAFYCPKGHSHNLINDTEEEIMFFAVVPELK